MSMFLIIVATVGTPLLIAVAVLYFAARSVFRALRTGVLGLAQMSQGADSLQERIFPMLAYLGLLAIVIKLTIF